jgi:putative photosynthetic complex assembly protein 2
MQPSITWAQLYFYPLLTTLVLWGMLTLGLLWLNRRGPGPSRIVLLILVGILALAHHQLWVVRHDVSVWGNYRAFIASMLIWSWHELAFYSGVLTGPWRKPCPPDAKGLRRLGYALATHLYHIAAVGADMLVLGWLHSHAANQVGLWAFVLFWLLQLNAKFNVLLGVRNLQPRLFPHHLRYLASFWAERSYNLFFWPSVVLVGILAAALWMHASTLAPDSRAIGISLLACLTTLGVLEHLMLVLPFGSQPETASSQAHEIRQQHRSKVEGP